MAWRTMPRGLADMAACVLWQPVCSQIDGLPGGAFGRAFGHVFGRVLGRVFGHVFACVHRPPITTQAVMAQPPKPSLHGRRKPHAGPHVIEQCFCAFARVHQAQCAIFFVANASMTMTQHPPGMAFAPPLSPAAAKSRVQGGAGRRIVRNASAAAREHVPEHPEQEVF